MGRDYGQNREKNIIIIFYHIRGGNNSCIL